MHLLDNLKDPDPPRRLKIPESSSVETIGSPHSKHFHSLVRLPVDSKYSTHNIKIKWFVVMFEPGVSCLHVLNLRHKVSFIPGKRFPSA